jgi:cobalt/nickel transport protein
VNAIFFVNTMANHPNHSNRSNRGFILLSLVIAVAIAVFLSPFASSDPDGLDRVSQDQGFDKAAHENPIAKQLPFFAVFEEYALRGVPKSVATPLAGLVGTLVTFGIAWGAGKALVKGSLVKGSVEESIEGSDPSDRT